MKFPISLNGTADIDLECSECRKKLDSYYCYVNKTITVFPCSCRDIE